MKQEQKASASFEGIIIRIRQCSERVIGISSSLQTSLDKLDGAEPQSEDDKAVKSESDYVLDGLHYQLVELEENLQKVEHQTDRLNKLF